MFSPHSSTQAWQERSEQTERRLEAMYRHQRQQFELFELNTDWPECPTCGEHAQPVYGRSMDPSVGYDSQETGCLQCMPRG